MIVEIVERHPQSDGRLEDGGGGDGGDNGGNGELNTKRLLSSLELTVQRSDLVAIQFGEFTQNGQRENQPFTQRRLAPVLRDINQTVRGAQSVAIDISHPILRRRR